MLNGGVCRAPGLSRPSACLGKEICSLSCGHRCLSHWAAININTARTQYFLPIYNTFIYFGISLPAEATGRWQWKSCPESKQKRELQLSSYSKMGCSKAAKSEQRLRGWPTVDSSLQALGMGAPRWVAQVRVILTFMQKVYTEATGTKVAEKLSHPCGFHCAIWLAFFFFFLTSPGEPEIMWF